MILMTANKLLMNILETFEYFSGVYALIMSIVVLILMFSK